ncbi:MAG: HEAT repeat domain-containing protein [Desulfobacterales bacterium]|nr:HEAT repeat domain-containing protein [Desulfobacterales bacterium]
MSDVKLSKPWETGSPEAVQPLINVLKNEDHGNVRKKAAEALGKIGDPVVLKPLIKAMKDTDPVVRAGAARALGETGSEDAVQPLIKAMKDSNYYVRMSVAEALNKRGTGSADAVDSLITALHDEYRDVSKLAAEGLGAAGDTKALKPLINIIKYNKKFLHKKSTKLKNLRKSDPKMYFRQSKNYADWYHEMDRFRHSAYTAINKIILSNKPLYESYPHLLCRKCLLRAKIFEFKAGMFERYELVACRGCEGSNLIKNSRKVVGLIGGSVEDFYINGNRVYVNLWSEQQKKARNADIDILEIRESEGTSYDYAINAVLVTLKNDASRPEKYVKSIPVVIHGNLPVPEGVISMLIHEFSGIKTEK